MNTEKRRDQIDRVRFALAETTKPSEELTDEDVEGIIQRLYGEDRQEAKQRWQSQLSECPIDEDILTMAVSDVKTYLADVVRLANRQGESVVVERRGEPVAAIISFADFVEYELLRREDMSRRFRKINEAIEIRRTAQGLSGSPSADGQR